MSEFIALLTGHVPPPRKLVIRKPQQVVNPFKPVFKCQKCKEKYPEDHFYWSTHPSGATKQSHCVFCIKAYGQEYRKKHGEAINARRRAKRAAERKQRAAQG